ncbi:hypothetical protein ACFU41_20995 [Bacillus subtilis]|jgi:hypothetical protein
MRLARYKCAANAMPAAHVRSAARCRQKALAGNRTRDRSGLIHAIFDACIRTDQRQAGSAGFRDIEAFDFKGLQGKYIVHSSLPYLMEMNTAEYGAADQHFFSI